ncbi:MAG: TonB-dependent receptor [Deltaproteobacteria bacterium]|nr:TonB-dependent receptor [Deltaproteobacteria bacterium]TLN01632.1 MAG: TonB-dependent receptor [bacterium]
MHKSLYKTTIFLLPALFLLTLCRPALAQPEREMTTLKMFYDEDDIVVTPTRYPKSISRVAENMTVITAEDIKAINAHTLADVLYYVPGVSEQITGGPSSIANSFIQGSATRHILLLIDGVPQNNLSDSFPDVGAVPVQFVERIEIIKGPASSTWGSSLGGVINIISKSPDETRTIGGVFSSSIGERNTGDYRIEASGKAAGFGYYLSGGGLLSDGLLPHNGFHGGNLYTKFKYAPTDHAGLTFTLGYNNGSREIGEVPLFGLSFNDDFKYLFSTLGLNYYITPDLIFDLVLRSSFRNNRQFTYDLPTGLLLDDIHNNERSYGLGTKLVWTPRYQEIVIGADFDSGHFKSLSVKDGKQRLEKWAIYANNTINVGKISLTPGIRYDHTSTNGDFWSPSAGVTYIPIESMVLRAYMSRGFSIPPLFFTYGDGFFSVANPDLMMEKVWSYSLGFETTLLRYVWLKTTLFRHDISELLGDEQLPDGKFIVINQGKQRRQGVEVEMKTMPILNTSLSIGYTFVDATDLETGMTIPLVARNIYDIGLQFDDRKSFTAFLKGRYIHWNGEPEDNGKYTAMIWDLHLAKKFFTFESELQAVEVFLSGHNLFNGAQYPAYPFRNTRRWFEGGVRFHF